LFASDVLLAKQSCTTYLSAPLFFGCVLFLLAIEDLLVSWLAWLLHSLHRVYSVYTLPARAVFSCALLLNRAFFSFSASGGKRFF